jgi:hypothetical protein
MMERESFSRGSSTNCASSYNLKQRWDLQGDCLGLAEVLAESKKPILIGHPPRSWLSLQVWKVQLKKLREFKTERVLVLLAPSRLEGTSPVERLY